MGSNPAAGAAAARLVPRRPAALPLLCASPSAARPPRPRRAGCSVCGGHRWRCAVRRTCAAAGVSGLCAVAVGPSLSPRPSSFARRGVPPPAPHSYLGGAWSVRRCPSGRKGMRSQAKNAPSSAFYRRPLALGGSGRRPLASWPLRRGGAPPPSPPRADRARHAAREPAPRSQALEF